MVQVQNEKDGGVENVDEVKIEDEDEDVISVPDIKTDILKPLAKGLFEQFCEENKVSECFVRFNLKCT